MVSSFRFILVLEVVVAFIVPFLMWLFGVFIWIALIVEQKMPALFLSPLILGGGFGIAAINAMMTYVLRNNKKSMSVKMLKFCLFSGVFALSIIPLSNALYKDDWSGVIILDVPPLLVTVHLVYLCRAWLFERDKVGYTT